MSELRRDPILGRWVVINTDASLSPKDFEKEEHVYKHADTCQFCYEREQYTPPEVFAIRSEGTEANASGWNVRVVPNKFPALKIEGELDKRGIGIFDISNGVGAHEVLIETPDHYKNFADFNDHEIVNYFRACQSRLISLAKDKRFKYIMIFKNYGESAGTSVEHAHSQIIALPMVPKYVQEELEGAQYYYNYRGRCVFCDMIDQEHQDKERIIAENDDFIAFCPFVPRFPFESWVIGKEHDSNFCSLIDEEKQYKLAAILREVLSRMKICLSDPSYNFYLHTSPVKDEYQKSFHWHLEIVPKLTRVAGYEWGTGLYVVPTLPSSAAKYLREANFQG